MTDNLAKISLYLSKTGLTTSDLLDKEKISENSTNFNPRNFSVDGNDCVFFCKQSHTEKTDNPPWLDFVNLRLSNENKINFESVSRRPSGLLLIHYSDRILAATFGTSSRFWLNMSKFESDFGIKAAMNLCGNEELRQTRSSKHSFTTSMIDRQVSRPSESHVFGMSEIELLSYISARLPSDKKVSLQGKDNLTVKIIGEDKFTWDSLVQSCSEYIEAYGGEEYKDLFPNYPNLTHVSEEVTEQLNASLIENLRQKNFDKVHLAIPEFLVDDEFSFSYSDYEKRDNHIVSHIDLDDLLDKKKTGLDLAGIDTKKLKQKQIYAYSHEQDKILTYKNWSLYSCIVAEIELDSSCYVLSSGEWRKVDESFYSLINDFIQNELVEEDVPEGHKGIDIYVETPDGKGQNREDKFNDTFDDQNLSTIKFDKSKLSIGGGRRDKEFCDLLDFSNTSHISIVHVKKYGGCSSVTYLFSQARLYCEAFLQDQSFLNDIRLFIQDSQSPEKTRFLEYIKKEISDVVGSDYVVKLWLLYNQDSSKPEKNDLPLMAKYELKLTYDLLRKQQKYKGVTLSMVPVAMQKKTSIVTPTSEN